MPARIYMLGFIFSRMLTPVSYTVFLLYFMSVYVTVLDVIPTAHLSWLIALLPKVYTPFLFIRLLLFATACTLFGLCVVKVIVFGRLIIRRSMFSFLLALAVMHSVIYFTVNSVPFTSSVEHKQHALHNLFSTMPIEVITTILFGIMLSLYVGILSREKFKKDIGFVDDSLQT